MIILFRIRAVDFLVHLLGRFLQPAENRIFYNRDYDQTFFYYHLQEYLQG